MEYVVALKRPFGKRIELYADGTADMNHLATSVENAYVFRFRPLANMVATMFNNVLTDASLDGSVNVPSQRFKVYEISR